MSTRKRVAISAYACGPVNEPEARAGWEFAVAAAENFDVHVYTRERFREPITGELADRPELREHLSITYFDLPQRIMDRKHLPGGLYWYYSLWQAKLARMVRADHAQDPFDLMHHATFANDWLPCGLAYVEGPPLIWGPVGGASKVPVWRLRKFLGIEGVLNESVRSVFVEIPRRIFGDRAARRSTTVIAQNDGVAHRFRRAARTVVEPNAILEELPERKANTSPHRPRGVFAGRLITFKGAPLALHALAQPGMDEWTLDILGDGRQRENLEKLARQLGVSDRVNFLGHRSREETLQAYATADALVFPSVHDQASWAVAEASGIGCPVVVLPLGGPPITAERNAHIASLDGDIVANFAEQMNAAAASTGEPHRRWSVDRLPELVRGWYEDAMKRGRA